MKKLVAILSALILLFSLSFCFAERTIEMRDIISILSYENLLKLNDMIDEYLVAKSGKTAFQIRFESLSYDELVQLKDQINLAMYNSETWQEVTVPAGVWEVGKDIPEGHWTIRLADDNQLSNIVYTDRLDEFGKDVTWGWKGVHDSLCNKKNSDGTLKYPEYKEETDIEMKSDMYFINKVPVVFTPYTGKPGLGFK